MCLFLFNAGIINAQTEDVVPKWNSSLQLTESQIYDVNGKIGIGVTNPSAKLTIGGGSFLINSLTGSTPASGGGIRLMWVPEKAALRAGVIVSNSGPTDVWDHANIGQGSIAFGMNTKAKGVSSFASGSLSSAEGANAIAFGSNCQALGDYSVSLGTYSRAVNPGSFTIGQYIAALSDNSFVIGRGTMSGAELQNNIPRSLMIGFNSDKPTLFVGPSDGANTTGKVGIANSNPSSTLDVKGNTIIGSGFSGSATAPSNGLLVEGSTGIGEKTPKAKLSVKGNTIIGSNYSGGNSTAPANGLIIEGNTGIGTSTPDVNAKLHVEGGAFLVQGHVGGTPASGTEPRLMWIPDKAAFRAGRVSGTEWDALNIGVNSVAMGKGTIAKGRESVAFGDGSIANERASIAMGYQAQANYPFSVAMGYQAIASGSAATSIGYQTKAKAASSFALGAFIENSIRNSLMVGFTNREVPTFFVGPGLADGNRRTECVSVGTANPKAKFHVSGDVKVSRENAGNQTNSLQIAITSNPITAQESIGGGSINFISLNEYAGGNPDISFSASNKQIQFIIKNDGKVGIGTINPQSLLSVNGLITAKEVKVTLSGFSDFVFKEEYKLMPIDELEAFIKTNSHLPDVPSEKEVIEKGVSLGELSAILLQKIEELTLYVIKQEKMLKELSGKPDGN